MVSPIEEVIEFFERNSDMQNQSVGITVYGISWIDFKYKLDERQQASVLDICKRYGLNDDDMLEMEDGDRLSFEVDSLVYLGKSSGKEIHNMQKLVDFLKQIKEVAQVEAFVTGIEFQLK